jgi:hypothetical protein
MGPRALRYLPSPEEHGPFYAMLASRQNRVVTGQTLIADSGTLNRAMIRASPTVFGISLDLWGARSRAGVLPAVMAGRT